MFQIEIKTEKSKVCIEERGDLSQAVKWAESIASAEQKQSGPIKSIEISEDGKLVASLRTVR